VHHGINVEQATEQLFSRLLHVIDLKPRVLDGRGDLAPGGLIMLVWSDPPIAPSSATTGKCLGPDRRAGADVPPRQPPPNDGADTARRPHPTVQLAGQPWLPPFAAPLVDNYGRCCVKRGTDTMEPFSAGTESGVESELIDLSAVSMTTLRELNDTAFRTALRHVVQQAAHPRVTSGGGTEDVDPRAARVD
jgi:hypothetical protein